MKFSYSVEIFEVIPEEKKRVLETLTGIVEADAKTAVPKCVWSGVRARVEQLGRETGMMISHGSLHVERASDSLASFNVPQYAEKSDPCGNKSAGHKRDRGVWAVSRSQVCQA